MDSEAAIHADVCRGRESCALYRDSGPPSGFGCPAERPSEIFPIYVGSTAEASFLLREPGSNPDIKLDIIAPKFVKVLSKLTQVRQFGQHRNDFVFGNVEIGIDTTTAGEFSGILRLQARWLAPGCQ